MEITNKRPVQIASLPRFGILSLIPNDLADKVTLFTVTPTDSDLTAIFVVGKSDVYQIKEDKVEKLCSFVGTEIAVEEIAASPTVILILGSDKHVYSLGNNRYGQIGNGQIGDVIVEEPFKVPIDAEITQIAIGLTFSACLASDGRVFTWGSKHHGRGNAEDADPQVLSHNEYLFIPHAFVQLAAFTNGAFALDVEGRLWCWGSSNARFTDSSITLAYPKQVAKGILKEEKIRRVQVDFPGSILFLLTVDGKLILWGPGAVFGCIDIDKPTVAVFAVPQTVRIVALAIETGYSSLLIAESENGQLFAWGYLRCFYDLTFDGSKRPRSAIANDDIFAQAPLKIPDHFQSALDAYFKLTIQEEPYVGCVKVSQSSSEPIGVNWAFANAFDDKTTSDFQVIVEDRTIYVHKAILSIRCGHFRRMFANTECKEVKENRLVINDCSYRVYKAFLRLLYTDILSSDESQEELSIQELFEVFDVAVLYVDNSLQRQVSGFIVKFMEGTPEDLLASYKFALDRLELFPESSLLGIIREKSFEVINTYFERVGESSFFESEHFDLRMARSLIKRLAEAKGKAQPST